MKIDLTITREGNQEKLSLELPTGWGQVPFEKFIKLKPDMKEGELISLFTGLDLELLRKAEIHNMNIVIGSLHFLQTTPTYLIPKTIEGYPVPSNLDKKSIAQFEDLKTIATSFTDDQEFNYSQFPLIVATYAVEPYDFQKAEELAPTFFKSSCLEVLAIGNFSLVRLAALRSGTKLTSPAGYKAEQIEAGYDKLAAKFGFYHTLLFMEKVTSHRRAELLEWSVEEFKHNLRFVAWQNWTDEKYADIMKRKK